MCEQPESGKLIPGAHGLRKLRWGLKGKGKRGGLRVIYYYRVGDLILFLGAYKKSDQEDLRIDQMKALMQEVEDV